MNNSSKVKKGQVVYFSHGGGPLPILGDPTHKKMIDFMKDLPSKINRPEAIIVFSAHWEEDKIRIQSGEKPDIMYDYYGFPKEAYSLEYPCLGNKELAKKVSILLNESNIENIMDQDRPYDHGSYIPLKMMYPEGDIPVIQISLNHNLDPLTHLKIGKALKPLLEENILLIGSGFSYHNMSGFDFQGKDKKDSMNNKFQDELIKQCCLEKDYDKRWTRFLNWEEFPGARYCHPREEHLLPLLVCVGLSENKGIKIFDDYILGKRATAFLW
ncbi:MAG: dioxygenase [Tissierellales bacterium]|jgi:aromatic ring-opening dioxygenase catalytic subunit (LigB family)|nr:dioxygenase [Tissierellales bacterium]